jgi:glycosyltransferase involved in cell wall biosynthesis
LGRKFLGFETARTATYEPITASRLKNVLVTSSKDSEIYQQLLKKLNLESNIHVIPNGVDLDYFVPGESANRKSNALVITGKMSYHANQKMVLHFVENILPLIWKVNPNVTLEIVGQNPPQDIQNLSTDRRIVVTGWVDDIRPYLQSASIAVAPLAYGAGIQNKILEAMACEIPVIASSTALEALSTENGINILASDNPQQFADLTLELLKSKERRHTIGKAGRAYVEKYHSWTHVAKQLTLVYGSLNNRNL